jgi:hydroxyacylglutathione hydrolase
VGSPRRAVSGNADGARPRAAVRIEGMHSMRLERIYTPGLAQVAYLVGDESRGVAAVIDPRRDIQVYLDLAQASGLRITDIFETHVHADFVSGALELAHVTDATIHAGKLGESEFPHHSLDDGDAVTVGSLRFTALWTPGHTPEHMSYLLTDPALGDQPQALFSGDMLFVGEVGRPDLLGSEATTGLVEQLYDSINERLRPLADDIIVYPGHGAGSSCGKSIGDSPSTTLGQEKRFNYAFQIRDRAAFQEAILGGMPLAPTYYPVLKQVNKAGAALIRDLPHSHPLTTTQVRDAQAGGALVIDARDPLAFGGAHIPGSVFAGLAGGFVTWVGWMAPYDRDVVLVLDDALDFPDARTELLRIGVDRVAGYLQGGINSWIEAAFDIETLPQVSVHEVKQRLDIGSLQVLDVRSADEWQSGHVPGACHRYAGEIVQAGHTGNVTAALADVSGNGPLAVMCASGYRSTVAASVLLRAGRCDVVNVAGGSNAWSAAGYPLRAER